MHRDLEIHIMCQEANVEKAKHFLLPNKLIYVKDIVQTQTPAPGIVLLDIPAVLFDEMDMQLLEKSLRARNLGEVEINPQKTKIFTQTTILSGLLVAGIVAVALFVHNFNEDLYNKIFLNHDIITLYKTATIIASSAVAGFFLEMLIIYRDRKAPSHY